MSRPQHLRLGLAAFVYFALVGVLLPLVLLTLRPVPDGPMLRGGVVLLLGSGLVAVVGYLILTLRSPGSDEEDAAP